HSSTPEHPTPPTTFYYNSDERQSVRNLTDGTGAVVQSYDYTAFGDKVDSLTTGSVSQRYTYTGRELNEASGDYYFRYRMYGAQLGGFLSRDPLKYVNGMSVYTGWFASQLDEDPMGRMTAKEKAKLKKCEGFKTQFATELANNRKLKESGRDDFWNDVIDIWDKIGNAKRNDGSSCGPPVINCGCCSNAGEYWHGAQYSSGEWIFPSEIKICSNSIDNSTEFKSLKYIFYHELIHWYDSCSRPTSGKNQSCEKSMCTEIRAYQKSGQCDEANRGVGESKQQCIVNGIVNSSWNSCSGKYKGNGGKKAFELDVIEYYNGYMDAISKGESSYKGCPTKLSTPPIWGIK
ncbi:hypothetical protein BVX99_00555, partial [bacterium F16]